MEISTATRENGDKNQLSYRLLPGSVTNTKAFTNISWHSFIHVFIFYYTLEIVKAKLVFPPYSLQNKQIKVYVGMV